MFKNIIKEQIEVPAHMSYLGQIRDFIEKIGKKYKFSEKIINPFKLVVDESCTNIIRHGYRDVKGGKIVIRAIIRRRSLTIILIDQGKSFDPRSVAPPDLKRYVEIGKKGGLGILMMRKLMEDIKYNITPTGNELRLTKMRDSSSDNWFKQKYDSLSLKTKFTAYTLLVLVLMVIVGYTFIYPQIAFRVEQRIKNEASNIVNNFAEYCYEPLYSQEYIDLFKSARNLIDANIKMVYRVIVTDSSYHVIAIDDPVKMIEYDSFSLDSLKLLETDTVTHISQYEFFDQGEKMLVVSKPIIMPEFQDQPLGYAMVTIPFTYFETEKIASKRFISITFMVVFLIAGFLIYFLISRIMSPFHQLAEWVRMVGQGKVDEDEIDVDASDELGEIAQAFNEMTSKFREAQVNLIEQQRMQKELQVAQEIQQMLLPQDFPNVEGFDIASYYEAAKEVGGDLFDFVEINDHTIGIIVADVSGKGVPGSLIMTMIRTALRLEARGNVNPAETLVRVNRFVMDDMKKGMFVTMFYLVLDSRERTISFASAGHNPMILYRGKTRKTYYLNPSGFPVGIKLPDDELFAKTISYDKIQLHPEDLLVIYTDGVTEAMNIKRDMYAEERFLDSIRKHGSEDVVDFITNTKNDIKTFTGGYEQNDDITVVAIKENLKVEEVKLNMLKELFELASTNNITVAEACEKIGVSPSTYYKYRKIYQNHGDEGLLEAIHSFTDIESNHLSIEEKTKIYDILSKHPTWGPKRISKELYNEEYGYAIIDSRKIYAEFIRAKLNTKERREKFVARGGKKRLKAPGTPLLTLDGKVILAEEQQAMQEGFVPQFGGSSKKNEIIVTSRKNRPENKTKMETKQKEVEPVKEEILQKPEPVQQKEKDGLQKNIPTPKAEIEEKEKNVSEKEIAETLNKMAPLAKEEEKSKKNHTVNLKKEVDAKQKADDNPKVAQKIELLKKEQTPKKEPHDLEPVRNLIEQLSTRKKRQEKQPFAFDIRKLSREELKEKLRDPESRKEILKQLKLIRAKKIAKSD